MFCKNCGNEISGNSKFCVRCGEEITVLKNKSTKKTDKSIFSEEGKNIVKKTKNMMMLTILSIFAIVGAAFVVILLLVRLMLS